MINFRHQVHYTKSYKILTLDLMMRKYLGSSIENPKVFNNLQIECKLRKSQAAVDDSIGGVGWGWGVMGGGIK